MNSNHAYQYNDSANEDDRITGPLGSGQEQDSMQEEQEQPQYKYGYPEFEPYAGEELLKEIVSAILPLALTRTWEKTISFGSQTPWAGTESISKRAQVTQRKIQQDLKDLQEMGLLKIKVGYETTVNNGQMVAYRVEYKDFSGLYDLAHEYHKWRQNRAFLMYQPIWQDCMRIREKHELYLKLMEDRVYHKELQYKQPELLMEIIHAEWHYQHLLKFHNYRRLLTQKLKPGKNNKSLGEIKTHNGLYLHETKNSDLFSSPYESILNSNNRFDRDSNLIQEKSVVTQDSTLTRSEGECRCPHDERGTHEVFTRDSGKGYEEQYDSEIPSSAQQHGTTFRRQLEPSRQRNAPKTVISAEAQQFEDYIVEHASKEKKRVYDSGKEKCREEAEKSKAIREKNKAVINLYSHIAHELNDEYEKSTGTSLVKMYEAWEPTDCEKSLETFTERFDYARQKVLAKPDKDIIKRTKSGASNRTPLFKTVIQGALTRGMEACIADDEQAQKVRDMWKVLGHKPSEEELAAGLQIDQELDAREDALVQAENNLQSWLGPLAQHIEDSHQRLQESMADVEAVEPEPAARSVDKWTQARDQIRNQMPGLGFVTVTSQHQCSCGCKLVVRQRAKLGCVVCKPPADWSRDFRKIVAEIVAQVRLEDAV